MRINRKMVLALVFRSFLFIIIGLFLSVALNQSLVQLSPWWSIVTTFVNLLTILLLFNLCKFEGITFKQLYKFEKGKTKKKDVLLGVVMTLVIGMGGMYLAGALIYHQFPYMAVMMIQPIPLWLAILNLFVLPLTTTLAEDGIYLGYASKQTKRVWVAILAPAFFYALQHSFIPLLLDGRYIIYRFLSFLPLTIIYALWYQKKQNLLPIMVGHFVINLATVLQILLTSLYPEVFLSWL